MDHDNCDDLTVNDLDDFTLEEEDVLVALLDSVAHPRHGNDPRGSSKITRSPDLSRLEAAIAASGTGIPLDFGASEGGPDPACECLSLGSRHPTQIFNGKLAFAHLRGPLKELRLRGSFDRKTILRIYLFECVSWKDPSTSDLASPAVQYLTDLPAFSNIA